MIYTTLITLILAFCLALSLCNWNQTYFKTRNQMFTISKYLKVGCSPKHTPGDIMGMNRSKSVYIYYIQAGHRVNVWQGFFLLQESALGTCQEDTGT
jgi:hypothetical protein